MPLLLIVVYPPCTWVSKERKERKEKRFTRSKRSSPRTLQAGVKIEKYYYMNNLEGVNTFLRAGFLPFEHAYLLLIPLQPTSDYTVCKDRYMGDWTWYHECHRGVNGQQPGNVACALKIEHSCKGWTWFAFLERKAAND